jgi:ankyrin repeat protein
MYAARDGRIESARLLIQNGANLEATDPNGITPLLMAITNNQMETARFFVERGAQINIVDWYGRSPLWSAVEVRNMDIDNATFVNGVDREPVLELIKLLLDKGANPNVRTAETPPIRRFILPITGSLEWVDFVGMTPFIYAARAGDLTVMKLLLEHGADPKIPTFAGTTALMAAAGMNWTFAQTYDEGTDHLLEAVKLCLDLGMSIHDMNSMGLTALHAAANRPGSDPIIKFLVEKGAKLDVKDNEGRTPLSWAEGVFLATHPECPSPARLNSSKDTWQRRTLRRMTKLSKITFGLTTILLLLLVGNAQTPTPASQSQTLLTQYCVTCHNEKAKTGGLRSTPWTSPTSAKILRYGRRSYARFAAA